MCYEKSLWQTCSRAIDKLSNTNSLHLIMSLIVTGKHGRLQLVLMLSGMKSKHLLNLWNNRVQLAKKGL